MSETLQAFRKLVGESDMLAYLSMMAPRLKELHRVLNPAGSIYLHCDLTVSHDLKLLMHAVFGVRNFGCEIVWKRSSAHSDTKQGRKLHGYIHDLRDTYGDDIEDDYDVIGEPTSVPDARVLAEQDPYQFQWWALGLVGARPVEQKKGADKGIDGRLYFHDDPHAGKTKQIVFSVKAGKTTVAHVRDLRGVVERENAEMGVLISMHPPTKEMRAEAANAGHYESCWGKHARIQLLTVSDLLAGKSVDMPPVTGVNVTYKRARRRCPDGPSQMHLREATAPYGEQEGEEVQ